MMYNLFVKSEFIDNNAALKNISMNEDYNVVIYSSFDELVTLVNRKDNNIIMLSGFKGAKHCYEISKIVKGKFFTSSVIVVANGLTARYQKMKRLDIHTILDPRADEIAVRTALNGARTEIEELRAKDQLNNTHINSTTVKNNIISVIGMRGGVGKTTIATNLAASFASYGYRVCLVDMALQFGDVSLYTNVHTHFTIADLLDGHLENENLEEYMTLRSDNLYVLPAPTAPDQAALVTKESTEALFVKLSNMFDVIVCDTPSIFNDISLQTIQLSKDILMVGTVDLASAKNCKIMVDLLTKLGLKDKIRLVVNKAGEQTQGLSIKHFNKLVNLPIFAAIPVDYFKVEEFVSLGTPFITKYPYEKITRAIESMVVKLNVTE